MEEGKAMEEREMVGFCQEVKLLVEDIMGKVEVVAHVEPEQLSSQEQEKPEDQSQEQASPGLLSDQPALKGLEVPVAL
ncbi:hypothetical protein Celaphus_00019612 [Cervus elaphus hippelaphus]|uniref:Uncharacterized protein n=1 Tax=Cervus elaphus hippelaphus TaxID=46360 RepID=A0A212BZJ1_CEREH|nr:hypothetical protein Celaphus_00019612 [Cervus elaphus hippelaphus]